jgi:hypothetical protein
VVNIRAKRWVPTLTRIGRTPSCGKSRWRRALVRRVVYRNASCRDAEEGDQTVDGDDEDVVLDALHPTQSHQAQDSERAVARPSPPTP